MDISVAMIVFNRPELSALVFERIAAARPARLFIVADGPRNNVELQQCEATRAVVEQINWPCSVERNYAKVNMGCRRRVASGLDWVFSRTEAAVILEDDCVPDPSFFPYCEELLSRYADDERVGHISGSNFVTGVRLPYSYDFSLYPEIWGWATWRRAWQHYDVDMLDWPKALRDGRTRRFFPTWKEEAYFVRLWEALYAQRVDTWDGQWIYAMRRRGYLSIFPGTNMISNVGCGQNATHTKDPACKYANLPKGAISYPLKHPPVVDANRTYDREYAKEVFGMEMQNVQGAWQRSVARFRNLPRRFAQIVTIMPWRKGCDKCTEKK